MKKSFANYRLLFVIAGLFLYSVTSFAQGKNTTITLVVNTADINQSNVNQMTQFFDSNGNSSTSGNQANFLSLIDLDKWVFWQGQVQDIDQNPGDVVNVFMIKKKEIPNNKSLLKKDEYTGTQVVKAKVKKRYEPGDESYAIHFTVIRNGTATDYVIDPKLKIRN